MALVIRNFDMVASFVIARAPTPNLQNKKPFRSGRKDFGIGSHLSLRGRALSHSAGPDAVGQGHSSNR
jgi:hypothetical protein